MAHINVKSLSLTAALAFAFTLAAPATSAYATDVVDCAGNHDDEFVKLVGRDGNICLSGPGEGTSRD